MLTSAELAIIYTEAELLTHMSTLKTQRTSLLSGGTIASVQTRDLSVSYGGLSTISEVDKALSEIARALQIISPNIYGNTLNKVRRYYAV